MDLTLAQAAARLNQTERQVRYLIKTGRLPAQKVKDRWVIREGDLPVSAAQEARAVAKAAALTQAVDDALAPHVQPARARVWTVERMRAFTTAVAAHRALEHGRAPRARAAVEACALALARGNHAFGAHAKRGSFVEARNHAAEAVAWLWMELGGGEVAAHLEGEVLPHIAGLLRSDDRERT